MTTKTEQQQQATHFAVRADVFGAAVKVIGAQPWEQVHQLMAELTRAQPMHGEPAQQPADEVTLTGDRNNTPPKP